MRNGLIIFVILVVVSGRVAANEYVEKSITHLKEVMDQFHDRIPVYDDISSPGNRFHAPARIPAFAAVNMNASHTANPHSGATAIRFEFDDIAGPNYGGFYLLNGVLASGETSPQLNFGTVPNAGVDLTGAVRLTFWARGEVGGERIDFFMGGVGRDAISGDPTEPYPDSTPRHPPHSPQFPLPPLSTTWEKFQIDVSGLDLSYVLGGFGWVADDANNPDGAIFYVDDIQYELDDARLQQRLDEPRFLRSFTTEPFQTQPAPVNDFDLVLRNLAFTYDNALALLAFLAENSDDSLRRARLIGDAFVYAAAHDRFFVDGRIRTAYAAGDIALPPGWTPNDRLATVPVPGFWGELGQIFTEVEQGSVDVGNNTWAMLALLALHRRTGDDVYLNAAKAIGAFILTFKNDTGTFKGFKGRIEGAESSSPTYPSWASTEHNLDVFAAFSALHAISRQPSWQEYAQHAQRFVAQMLAPTGCYLTGTVDPETRNDAPGQLPLDAQSWGVLAQQPKETLRQSTLLACAEQNHQLPSDGYIGFDFNEDKDGIWFEGTAQMAAAYALTGRQDKADTYLTELRRAQATPPFGDGQGLVAGSHDGISTGFEFKLFRRLHLADVAWHVFAELDFNPFHTDLDNDGMPDNFEQLNDGLNFLDPGDSVLDNDQDGLRNLDEFMLGTGVNLADSDGDGINDGDEIANGTNPLLNEASISSIINGVILGE